MKKAFFVACAAALAFAAGCSSKSEVAAAGTDGVTKCDDGSTSCDTHCGSTVQATDPAVCNEKAPADAGPDPTGGSDFGATMNGTEGDDDDCKYHVKWSAAGVAPNQNVTFHVVATKKTDGSPLTGANPYAEIFLDSTHPAPNSPSVTTETSPGHYDIGPWQFDEPGKWTVRFHFFAECSDLEETSQHGHAAFFVTVP